MQNESASNPGVAGFDIRAMLEDSTDQEKAAFLRQINSTGNPPEIVAELAKFIKGRATLSRIGNVSDIVGTGGDSKNTINVSTAASLVVSSLGVSIAKHGNFGATSNKGSADFLRYLGYNFEMGQEALKNRIRKTSFAFILAPRYNDSFSKFAKARKMIPVKTVFNYLGPLTNPADPDVLMLGVTHREISDIYTEYLLLNGKRGCVLYSEDGMDEVSPYSRTFITRVENGEKSFEILDPEKVIGDRIGIEHISSADPLTSFKLTLAGISGNNRKAASFIALNAALSLFINGKFSSLEEAYGIAMDAISSGLAGSHLQKILEVASDV